MPSVINECFLLASFKFGFVKLLTLRKVVIKAYNLKEKGNRICHMFSSQWESYFFVHLSCFSYLAEAKV